MLPIVGIIIVIGAIIGGYLMEHGKLMVLMQPAELIIIGGASLGTVLIANPLGTIIKMAKGAVGAFLPSRYSKGFYLENLRMLSDVFVYARKNGLVKLEPDVEDPSKSALFAKYPKFLKDHQAVHFFCDTLRMAVSGGVQPFDLDQMMELDMDVHHHEASAPVAAITSMADALPGLGIVAAVLGVVITMGALGGPPEEIGHKVAAALVGTFLGILLCYGFFGPLATNMAGQNEAEMQYYYFLRVGLMAFVKGSAPVLAIEFARRSIPSALRPSFQEMEKAAKGGSPGTPEAAAA
jgi:chemotaxis protein MotA